MARYRFLLLWLLVLAALAGLALLRPIDHDESQYVAATVLSGHGLLPYRDYAYLQTPLQPLLFAPIAASAGANAWVALRLANALCGAIAVAGVFGAARSAGVRVGVAIAAAGLFAATDAFLFSIGTARNDALPVACLATALWLIVRQEAAPSRGQAMAIGLLLAAAAAAKLSYALPAAVYAGATLLDRPRRLPLFVLLGAAPVLTTMASLVIQAPENAWFGIFTFPAHAPAQYYVDNQWKSSLVGKLGDALKFLALGPALPALAVIARRRRPTLADALILAGLVAALLPWPTWRQYLLPMLPPLFLRLAELWEASPPARPLRIAMAVFAGAGLAPSAAALAGGAGLAEAARQGDAIRNALTHGHVTGTVATLSPEFLPATYRLPDPRFATGPFYFRSRDLLDEPAEMRAHLVSRARLDDAFAIRPEAVLIGGEGKWTSGDDLLEAPLNRWAETHGYVPMPVAGGRFRLWVRPPQS